MKKIDVSAAATRVHRAVQRDNLRTSGVCRLVVVSPEGSIATMPMSDPRANKLLAMEAERVVGVYDNRVFEDDLLEDIEWSARRWGLL